MSCHIIKAYMKRVFEKLLSESLALEHFQNEFLTGLGLYKMTTQVTFFLLHENFSPLVSAD